LSAASDLSRCAALVLDGGAIAIPVTDKFEIS
jgi:hypothetical protein